MYTKKRAVTVSKRQVYPTRFMHCDNTAYVLSVGKITYRKKLLSSGM